MTDLETGKSSGWLELGQAFQGFTLKEFDRAGEVLLIARDANVQRLLVKKDRILDGQSQSPNARALKFEFQRDGRMTLNGGPISLETIEQMVRKELARPGKLLIHLQQPENGAADAAAGKKIGEAIYHFTRFLEGEVKERKARKDPCADPSVSIASKGTPVDWGR